MLLSASYRCGRVCWQAQCDGGARVMERSTKISISCLIEYKVKEEREGERREV